MVARRMVAVTGGLDRVVCLRVERRGAMAGAVAVYFLVTMHGMVIRQGHMCFAVFQQRAVRCGRLLLRRMVFIRRLVVQMINNCGGGESQACHHQQPQHANSPASSPTEE